MSKVELLEMLSHDTLSLGIGRGGISWYTRIGRAYVCPHANVAALERQGHVAIDWRAFRATITSAGLAAIGKVAA